MARLSMRWIVAVLLSLVAFGGCAAGLWLAGVDAAVALGIAVAPFTIMLTVLGWWAARADSRGSGSSDRAGRTIAKRTGPATARGPGSKANSGVIGSGIAKRTGKAEATEGGSANTGVDSSGSH